MKSIDIFNELSDHVNIKINSCVEQFHDSTWLENKVHNDYDIWLILEGDVSIEIGGSTYSTSEGDIVFFYPGMPYSAAMGQNGCRFIFIHFEFSIGNNFKILNDFNFAGIISCELLKDEARLFKSSWCSCKKSGVPSILLKAYFTVLLSKIMDICGTATDTRSCFPKVYRQKYKDKLAALQPVFKHISENMARRIRVCELADRACMSEKYFINYFKDTIGVSPLVYINQVKMNQARNYLYQGSYSVKQISSLLGYSDQYTFSKAFKKHYNVSPSNFI